jgi:hypothetical protein
MSKADYELCENAVHEYIRSVAREAFDDSHSYED